VDVQVKVSGGDEVEEFASLWQWLASERALAGAIRAIRRAPGEAELGGAFDVLAVALGSGGTGVALANSLTTWLRTRRSHISVTVATEAGTVTVDARNASPSQILPLLQQVLLGPGA
jgi:hypothetical protein